MTMTLSGVMHSLMMINIMILSIMKLSIITQNLRILHNNVSKITLYMRMTRMRITTPCITILSQPTLGTTFS
jgi:hypothetical protein